MRGSPNENIACKSLVMSMTDFPMIDLYFVAYTEAIIITSSCWGVSVFEGLSLASDSILQAEK